MRISGLDEEDDEVSIRRVTISSADEHRRSVYQLTRPCPSARPKSHPRPLTRQRLKGISRTSPKRRPTLSLLYNFRRRRALARCALRRCQRVALANASCSRVDVPTRSQCCLVAHSSRNPPFIISSWPSRWTSPWHESSTRQAFKAPHLGCRLSCHSCLVCEAYTSSSLHV